MWNKGRKDLLASIKTLHPKSRVIGLSVIIIEVPFITAIYRLPESQVIWAIIGFALILIAAIAAVVMIELRQMNDDPPVSKNEEPRLSHTEVKNYDLGKSIDFYQVIAEGYDERNSSYLKMAHRSVIEIVERKINQSGKAHSNILDLGGGTGRLIVEHFFNKEGISWFYLDKCEAMASLFKKNLKNTKLATDVKMGDLVDASELYEERFFDLVIVSFVLTSMEKLPSFNAIVDLLVEDGVLIVADIDHSYTISIPDYSVLVNDETHVLHPKPINPLSLCEDLGKLGMRVISARPVLKDEEDYAFCLEFIGPRALDEKI